MNIKKSKLYAVLMLIDCNLHWKAGDKLFKNWPNKKLLIMKGEELIETAAHDFVMLPDDYGSAVYVLRMFAEHNNFTDIAAVYSRIIKLRSLMLPAFK